MLRGWLLCLLLALPLAGQAQKIYKWTDAEGRVQYTQTPPPDDRAVESQDMHKTQISELRRDYCREIEKIAQAVVGMRMRGVPQVAASEAARRLEVREDIDVDLVALRELVNFVYAGSRRGNGSVSGRAHDACLGGSFGRVGLGARSSVQRDTNVDADDPDEPGLSRPKPRVAYGEPISGTGWITRGLIATNFHVIRDRSRIRVRLSDGRELVASIVAKDEGNDVALLRVDEDLPTGLPVADGEAGLGATVFTLGYPHTGIMGRNVKLSTGIISSQTGLRDDSRTYQISVPVQAGNSGGPLINSRGEVVGLVTAKLSAAQVFRWTGDLPQNVNYAVKVAYLNALMPAEHSAVANQPATDADLEALVARATPAVVLVIAD